jgi:hypothetical protein
VNESWRLGNERSEDALSWNVFVTLAGLRGLGVAFQRLTGIEVDVEPELYLWGMRISDERPQVWTRLKDVRLALENGAAWPTEPDVMLRVPGRAIALIEAKLSLPTARCWVKRNASGLWLSSLTTTHAFRETLIH